ncbi:hypothetical protein [Burkholderia ambifaria]|nr:hypothetical protein [Burkholderia ambifaria]
MRVHLPRSFRRIEPAPQLCMLHRNTAPRGLSHHLHAAIHQVGSILAFLAHFLRKEATAWMV